MRSQGHASVVDGLVDLFCDAMAHFAATLHRDASTRHPADGLATQGEIDQRIAAACRGAADAFAAAAELRAA
jgi:hypothetical protein